MADEKTRFTDAELKEFKEIILGKLEDAKNDYDLLKSSMSGSDDHGTNDTSPTFKLMEDGSDVLSREETAQLAVRQQKFIKHLEDALIRIANKVLWDLSGNRQANFKGATDDRPSCNAEHRSEKTTNVKRGLRALFLI